MCNWDPAMLQSNWLEQHAGTMTHLSELYKTFLWLIILDSIDVSMCTTFILQRIRVYSAWQGKHSKEIKGFKSIVLLFPAFSIVLLILTFLLFPTFYFKLGLKTYLQASLQTRWFLIIYFLHDTACTKYLDFFTIRGFRFSVLIVLAKT